MKKLNLLLFAFLLAITSFASNYSTYYCNVISHETGSITGSLTVNGYFICDTTTIFTGAMEFNIPTGWSATGTSFNGTTGNAGDSLPFQVNITYPTTNLPFFPVMVSVTQKADAWLFPEPGTLYDIENTQFQVYFTPYNTVEVWNQYDLKNLNREWLRPELVADTMRVYIPKSKIPVAVFEPIPYPSTQKSAELEENTVEIKVPGMAYQLLTNTLNPDTIALYREYGDGPDSVSTSKGKTNFYGTVTGRLVSNIINDQNVSVQIPLSGIWVRLMDQDGIFDDHFGDAYTDINGYFTISYNRDQRWEGNSVELYLKFVSKTDNNIEASNASGWAFRFNSNIISTHKDTHQVNWGTYDMVGDSHWEFDAYRVTNWANRAKLSIGNSDVTGAKLRMDIKNMGSGSYYNRSAETIHLKDWDADREDATYHEFGHFVMDKIQGRLELPWGENGDIFSHSWDEENSTKLAWIEGWADFVGMMLDAANYTEDNEYGSELITYPNYYEKRYPFVGINNGVRSEYNIACALYDLWDGSNKIPKLPDLIPNTTIHGYNDNGNWTTVDDIEFSITTLCGPLDQDNNAINISDYKEALCSTLTNEQKSDVSRALYENGVVWDIDDEVNGQVTCLATDNIYQDIHLDENVTWPGGNLSTTFKINYRNANTTNAFTLGASGAITPIIDPLIVGGTYASTRYTNFYLQPSYNSSLTTGTYKTYGQTKVIIYYGTLEVGKTGNTTTLDISDKGFLNIVSPGVLKILANSEVIIRSGAKISMQPGGQIIIEGNGKLTIESGAIVNLNGGTIDLQSTQSVFNLSQNLTINSSGNTIEFKGVGSLTVKSGVTLSVASNTTLKTVCPVTVITGGTLSILTGGKLLLSGNTVTLNSTGVLNVAGSLILNTATSNTITGAGKMVYSGAITFNTGSTLTFQSNLWLADTKNLTLSVGKMKFGSGYSIKDASGDSWSGDIALSSNCELEIPTGISLTLGTGNDINLSTNGKLTVNGTLNLNGGILINDATSIFVLNGSVNVTSPSSINLGSITTYNGIVYATSDGNLIVESGKTIDLTSGKTINISNSGILTINGSLNMNGGTFSKNGTSKLYLNGVLNFSPYYTFTIDCYTELNGTINVPANFSLTFSGSNKSTVLLNVKKSFVFDADLANLTIQNGKIIMDNSTSELYFNNGIDNINLNNIWVTSATGITNNSHQGIDIRSDENITITNSIFEMGNYGVYSSRSATAQNLNITNSTFKSCDYGLRVYNSGVTIDGSTFESNTAMGIYCTSMDKSSSISNSTIRYQSDTGDYGVYYEGASTAVLNFDSNIITNNYNGVCLVGSFNTVFKCNFITTNSNYGVNTQNNGAIYLANAAGITGGNNDMHSNKIALSGSGTTQYFNSFYLNNGYNDLRDNGVSGSYCMSGQFGAFCGGAVAANNNYWKTGGGAPVDGVDYLLYGGCTNPDNPILFARLQVTDNSPENSFTLCSPLEEPGPLELISPYGADAAYRTVTTDLGTQPLNIAVEEILNTDAKQGPVYDLNTQYGLLGQVLTNDLGSLNSGEAWYAKHSYNMFMSELGKFGKQEGTDKVDQLLTQKMLQVIRKLQTDDNQGNGNNNGKKHNKAYFAHAMDEAQILWLEQDYDGAITLLQKLAKKADADQLCEIQKLTCQIEIDREFIASGNTLEIEELLTKCTECSGTEKSGSINTSGGENENAENPTNPLNLVINMSVVPNPVTGSSEIRINGLQQAATLVVYNSTGAKVMDESIVTSSYSRMVSNTDLPAGIYMVTLNQNGTVTQTLKMVVVK